MKKLLAIALLVAPFSAHAIGRGPGPGTVIAPVKLQIKSIAQTAGYLGNGSGEHVTVRKLKGGEVKATIWAKGSGVIFNPSGKGHHVVSTATFKLQQEPDGQIATGVKQNGRLWQPIEY